MDFNKIAIFVRVIDCGGISKAAELLRKPKSRVSRNIAALERELGTPLLYRTTRQSNPTDAGRALYERCRQHVYDLEAVAGSLHDVASEVRGILKLTAPEDIGSALLAPLLLELRAQHPDVSTELELTNAVVDLVRDGIDLGIRIGELRDSGLKSRNLGQIRQVLVASPRYLRQSKRLTRIEDLSTHACLVFDPAREGNRWTLSDGKRTVTVPLRPQCRANNPLILRDLALDGLGIALIPEFLCRSELKDGSLKQVLKPFGAKPVSVQLVWPSHRTLSPKVRAFIDLCVKRLAPYFS